MTSKRPTFEQLLNGEVNDVSIVGAALSNEPIDFTVKAESALERAQRRWFNRGDEHEQR